MRERPDSPEGSDSPGGSGSSGVPVGSGGGVRPTAGEAGPPSAGEEAGRRRLDLSVPQVAGSAVAAVVAAKLASSFGVYGTILGAGVVSVVATCGGSVFQHFFTRTGEQFRGATAGGRGPEPQTPPAPGEYGAATVHRARIRSWRRPVIAAAVVFGVTMAGITVYEAMSGSSFSGGTGTTVGDAFTGHGAGSSDTPDGPAGPGDGAGSGGSGGGSGDGTATPGSGGTPSDGPSDPSAPDGGGTPGSGGDGGSSGEPTPAPGESTGGDGSGDGSGDGGADGGSGDGGGDGGGGDGGGDGGGTPGTAPGSSTTPEPGADSRSGTAAADPAGPAAR